MFRDSAGHTVDPTSVRSSPEAHGVLVGYCFNCHATRVVSESDEEPQD